MVTSGDSVLSISSGGDNTLALLSKGPKRVVSIDLNPAQNYLLELKHAAARQLSYAEYLEFLGVRESTQRVDIYKTISSSLSAEAVVWWGTHTNLIRNGIIHSGRFEKFVRFFARYVLPYIHSRKTITSLLSSSEIEAQKEFYETKWNTALWRLFFRIASSRFLLGRARQPIMFTQADTGGVAEIYRQRLERHLRTKTVRGNFFLEYNLTGNYVHGLPPYLEENCYQSLRKQDKDSLCIVSDTVLEYFRSTPDTTFSAYNLSDIFEALSDSEHESMWQEIVRTAKPGARIAYWTNLVPRTIPITVAASVTDEHLFAEDLHAKDRVFFYDTFKVHTIVK